MGACGGLAGGQFEYEDFLSRGDESFELTGPEDENDAIALNYTSGTTGDPKVRPLVVMGVDGNAAAAAAAVCVTGQQHPATI